MWIGHWYVGLGFYIGMSVAVWIEGVPALIQHKFTVHDITVTAPSLRTAVSLLLFLMASGIQHDCHAYLASLSTAKTKDKTEYQLPTFPAFSMTLTPHYFMECLIYLSLAILAAPEDHWFNMTILCALVFVVTNLGVTAIGTRQWYEKKFGKEAIAGRYAMIPFVL
jgi:3-oxo-5-alpha-steroid 4-dehydrogenase 3 / polyprenol reductase